MSDGPAVNSEEKDMIDSSLSSSGGQKPLIHHERNRCLLGSVIITSLLLIWGVSLLPTIFYGNKLPAPHINMSNQTMPVPHYPCSHPLILNKKTKMCEPPCPWVTLTSAEDFAMEVVDNLSISVSLLGFIIILATWIRIKQLRRFPHIIPLYIQGLQSAIAFLLAVANGMGREKAFCSSKFYSEVQLNPTTFCTAQGVLIHYFSVALSLWFVVYSINLLQMICSGNVVSLQGNTYKVMHVVCSLTCWLLPWIPVGVVLGSKSTSYQPFNMRLCYPIGSRGTGFFTTAFITAVSQGVGCTCLFFVVYKLFMQRDISTVIGKQAELRKKKMNKVVKRLVILMIGYAVIMALAYIPVCIMQQHSKLLEYYTNQYFSCLMFSPPGHCPKTYEKYAFSRVSVVSTLSSAFFALITVCFLAFNKQSRKLWSFWWFRIQSCCGGNSQ
ncbi:uncharacterized protein LOC110060827 [Orbicella faveolata]|uniref:uncharacterized protein LOC110060827 n=1 Tax=Orbicella faveolata TaxID=48498 RepID=UPI0009E50CFF|nr:uncharacterized protein LOC110060827 [Orbicella faveolata]